MKAEKNTYERSPITTPEQVYDLTREVRRRGELVCVFTDLDETVLVGRSPEDGFGTGDDPRRVEILTGAALALKEISMRGGHVGVITNRGGRDAANYLRESGITKAHIIGTYGWERYSMDTTNPENDTVLIDDRFKEHASTITSTLTDLQDKVCNTFGEPISDDGANVIIPMNRDGVTTREQGPLIIQKKGVSEIDGFPLGLANIYNFNLMPIRNGFREKLKAILEETYREHEKLRKLWGMGGDIGNPEMSQRFTRGFEPIIKEGKAYAMTQMLRNIESAQRVGLVIFSGDSNADAQAMRAARLLQGVLGGTLRSIGIAVQGISEANELHAKADLTVHGPEGNAKILQGIAEAMQ